MSLRIAVKAAQTVLKANDSSIAVDGLWGRRSESAYVSAPEAIQRAAEKAVVDVGYSMNMVRKVSSDSDLVSPDSLRSVIARVSRETGVSEETLQRFADLEAARVVKGGVRYYVANAINAGGYRGLFQFDARGNAWADASKKGALPSFKEHWSDPYYNTLAAAYYTLFNGDVIRRRGYKGQITGSIAYLMHNQGATGAYRIMAGEKEIVGRQSSKAVVVANEAIADYKRFATA